MISIKKNNKIFNFNEINAFIFMNSLFVEGFNLCKINLYDYFSKIYIKKNSSECDILVQVFF